MIYFRGEEGIRSDNPNNGRLSPMPSGLWWTGFGSHQAAQVESPPPQLKSSKSNKGHVAGQFTIHSGDCKDLMPEHRLKPAIAQHATCAKYQSIDPWYGVFSAYGPHLSGGIMLPLSSAASDGLVIYVNPKQYPAIIRRRESRAKAEQENRLSRVRKPYMHESRHLHAKRRPRGCGGRFLDTKSSNPNNPEGETEKKKSFERYHSSSQSSEVLQSENRTLNSSWRGTDSSRASLSGYNEVTSMYSGRDTVVNHTHWPFHFPSISKGKV
ncbi:hypothetical protein CDL15_Pgr003196 [Punica granatum]|nr:hypothetical protein CDL15_Pgr003196 [Punica granatum]